MILADQTYWFQFLPPLAIGAALSLWAVSRDFAVDDVEAGTRVATMFADYYARVMSAMETAQSLLDLDGPGPEVNVSADVAALKVREIVTSMLAEEGLGALPRTQARL